MTGYHIFQFRLYMLRFSHRTHDSPVPHVIVCHLLAIASKGTCKKPSAEQEVRQQIHDYKKYWDLIQNGAYYRLHTPGEDTEMAAWNFVSEDKKEALLNIVSLTTHANAPVSYVKCRGLTRRKYISAKRM